VWNHSITVNKDVHEEDGPSPGDCFGVGCDVDDEQDASAGENSSDVSLIPVLAVTSLVGMVALALSIRKERIEQQGAKAYLEEE
jgi:hypothetical protein